MWVSLLPSALPTTPGEGCHAAEECMPGNSDVFAHSQGGNVWEKAGVNVSVVYGSMPAEAYRAATTQRNGSGQVLATVILPAQLLRWAQFAAWLLPKLDPPPAVTAASLHLHRLLLCSSWQWCALVA